MEEQNFKTHRRLIAGHHGFSVFAIFALIAGSVINLLHSEGSNLYSAPLLMLMSVVLLFLWFYSRVFALKAQDRVIQVGRKLKVSGNDRKAIE